MSGFEVNLNQLDSGMSEVRGLAATTKSQATELEGECESTPKVGDVQAAAVFQQAHYDWTQTRFEDLMESETKLGTAADNLHKTVTKYRNSDDLVAKMLARILCRLDSGG